VKIHIHSFSPYALVPDLACFSGIESNAFCSFLLGLVVPLSLVVASAIEGDIDSGSYSVQ